MANIKIIDKVKHIVVSLVEIDQDAIVLEELYRPISKDRVIARIDETIGALMKLREEVKAITKESYISKQ